MFKKVCLTILIFVLFIPFSIFSIDTTFVDVFDFEDASPEGWGACYKGIAQFPEQGPWRKVLMRMTLKCDESTKADEHPCGEWDYLTKMVIHAPKADSTEMFELGSFVTPYGLGLDLGKGRTWQWDVTDFQSILKGELKIEAGNNQELLNLSFLFIEGNPPRLPLSVENIWQWGNYKYGELLADSVLAEKEVILPKGSQFRLLARISGHGHHGSSNCCEWMNKTHSYLFNGYEVATWNVWKDCGANAIAPQGGTWPFDRAGWCPGTKVDEFHFDFSGSENDTVLIDYKIEQAYEIEEAEGNFRMSHLLFAYSAPENKSDIEVLDIISPTNKDDYAKKNPNCDCPVFVLRNNGSLPVKEVVIDYGINGSHEQFIWHGNLEFLETDTIFLPSLPVSNFADSGKFTIEASLPQTMTDAYIHDNTLTTSFKTLKTLEAPITIELLTNNVNRAKELELIVQRQDGTNLLHLHNLADSTFYSNNLDLENGCYQLLLKDANEDGMSVHWWRRGDAPEKVGINGQMRIITQDGDSLRFHPDFGEQKTFWFIIGD